MKVTLQVNGRERTFSEQELVAIVEKHFANQATSEEKTKVAQKPTEGEWFQVNPGAINQELFQTKRNNKRQEETRQLILEAFAKVKENPEKYGKPFKTMMPEKTWSYKMVGELKELAKSLGNHNADWVEQALEWAQRIQNGETWEEICNEPDTANWYRLVVWKDGYARLVGGSRKHDNNIPASDVNYINYSSSIKFYDTVPLVVL